MKKILFSLLLSAGIAAVFAQKPIVVSIGGGISGSPSALKDNSYLGNGYNIEAGAFFPLYRKGWDGSVKGSKLTLGISVLADYTGVKNLSPDNAAVAAKYKVFNETTQVTSQPEAKSSGSFSGLAGLQGIFSFGKFNVAPSLNAGYLQLNQKGFVQNGSAKIDDQAYEAALIKSEAQSTGGFVFIPQIKIGYDITPGFSLFVSPSVLMGPEVKHTMQHLVPLGGFNERNTYDLKQLVSGTWESGNTTTSKLNLTRINFGVSFGLGRRSQSSTMPSRLSMTPTTTRQTQGKTFGESVATGLQSAASGLKAVPSKSSGLIDKLAPRPADGEDDWESPTIMRKVPGCPLAGMDVILGGNNNSAPAKAKTNKQGEVTFKGLKTGTYDIDIPQRNEAQDFNSCRSNRDNRLVTNPGGDNNGTTDTVGNTAISTAQDFNSTRGNRDNRLAARPGGPIGGIIVKGGRNPGGMTNLTIGNDGKIRFEVLENGDYKFQVSAPSTSGLIDKLAPRLADGGTESIDDWESPTIMRKVPGCPLAGMDVILGGNNNDTPAKAKTNKQGEVTFKGLKTGTYDIDIPQRNEAQDFNSCRSNRDNRLVTNPGGDNNGTTDTVGNTAISTAQDFNSTRSNRERGQSLARPGQPIGGITVKGGKNPGGAMISLIAGDNGKVQFEVLEAGDYKFIFYSPEETSGGKTQHKPATNQSIVNTTKSNTKD